MVYRPAGNYLDAAEAILSEARQPLHYAEITKRAVQRGLIRPKGYTPEATMRGQLQAAVKRGDRFARIGPGTYRLMI